MKKKYPILLIVFFFQVFTAKAQMWSWGKQLSKCADTVLETKLIGLAANTNDIYVVMQQYFVKASQWRHQVMHFNSSGALTWTQSLPNFWELMNVVADQAGDVYFSGRFYGSGQVGPYTLTALNGQDIFLVKMQKGGQVQWAKTIDNHASDYNCALSVSRNNELMIVLDLYNTLYNGNFRQMRDTSRTEHVIARYNAAGNLVSTCKESGAAGYHYWADQIDVIEGDSGKLYWSSNIAYYTQYAEFKVLSSTGVQLAATGISDYYYDMQLDSKGYIYIILNTGSHYWGAPVLVKYDSNFNKMWSLGLGGTYSPYNFDHIAIDSTDRIFVSGHNGNSYFGYAGTNVFGNDTVSYSGLETAFLAEIDTSGNYVQVAEHPIKGSSFTFEAQDNAGALYLGATYVNADTSFTMGTDYFDLEAGAQYNYAYCAGTSLLKWMYYGPASIVQNNSSILFSDIFPNPAAQVAYVPVSRSANYYLINAHGEEVLTGKISPGCQGISVSDLPKGIYFVRVSDGRNSCWRKLLVQ